MIIIKKLRIKNPRTTLLYENDISHVLKNVQIALRFGNNF